MMRCCLRLVACPPPTCAASCVWRWRQALHTLNSCAFVCGETHPLSTAFAALAIYVSRSSPRATAACRCTRAAGR